MSMWQQELSVEQQVALNMGDEDWDEIEVLASEEDNDGCSRRPRMEVEKSNYLEAEPMGLKFNPLFDQ